MITDPPAPAFSPEDLRKNFERLQSDLNIVQNELDQALDVWRAILVSEKKEFKKLLEDHEKTWDREEAQWQKDRQAYEQKIQELETTFNSQLSQTEKNAVRALNELDAAWQLERVRWQQALTQQSQESRQREALQNATQQQLEQHIARLTEENAQLQTRAEIIAPLEARLSEWEAEKDAWQQSLSDRLNELRQTEERSNAELQQKDALILSLQQDLVTLEQKVRNSDQSQRLQQKNLETYVNSLETQIAVLQDFMQQIVPPSHPLRRQSDRTWSGGESVNSLSRGPY